MLQPFPELLKLSSTTSNKPFLFKDGYTLENNDYGAFGYEHEQIAYKRPAGIYSLPIGGWSWNYPEPSGGVMGYPEIIRGKKPWADANSQAPDDDGNVDFPCPALLIGSLVVRYDLRLQAEGKYNLAFDLWFCDHMNPDKNDRKAELMVWLTSAGGAVPAGRYMDHTFTDRNGCTWHISYAEPNKDWEESFPYICFQLEADVAPTGTLDLSELISEAIRRNLLPQPERLFLASVELGTEIWSGSGSVVVESYEVVRKRPS